jgi:hypothetical protein
MFNSIDVDAILSSQNKQMKVPVLFICFLHSIVTFDCIHTTLNKAGNYASVSRSSFVIQVVLKEDAID